MNKRKIVYNHIKKIKKSRKEKKEGCCGYCIFNMHIDVLTFLLGIERDAIFNSCPLAAYVLLIYGFIDSHTFANALKKIHGKHSTLKKITDQNFNSLSEKRKRSIIEDLQTYYVDCTLGNKQECSIVEVNKI